MSSALCLLFSLNEQLVDDFVRKENIPFEGLESAEILLGRDTRPSGDSLLEAAKKVWIPFEFHESSLIYTSYLVCSGVGLFLVTSKTS